MKHTEVIRSGSAEEDGDTVNIGLVLVVSAILVAIAVFGVLIWRRTHNPGDGARRADTDEPSVPSVSDSIAATGGNAEPRPAYNNRKARHELLLLDEELHRALLEEELMTPEEWAQIADSVVLVHGRMSPELAVERFRVATETELTVLKAQELEPRKLFAHLNEQLPARKRLRLLRELPPPHDADLYLPPESPESSKSNRLR